MFYVYDKRNVAVKCGPYAQDAAEKLVIQLNNFVRRHADITDYPFYFGW